MNPADRYDSLFMFWSEHDQKRHGAYVDRPAPVDWMLLKRQAWQESRMNPDAVSRVGAKGLTQFMDATWKAWVKNEFGTDEGPARNHVNQFDPEDAIRAQADMMAWLLKTWHGDVRRALASYNFGIGNVAKAVQALGDKWEERLPAETRGYLKAILE